MAHYKINDSARGRFTKPGYQKVSKVRRNVNFHAYLTGTKTAQDQLAHFYSLIHVFGSHRSSRSDGWPIQSSVGPVRVQFHGDGSENFLVGRLARERLRQFSYSKIQWSRP